MVNRKVTPGNFSPISVCSADIYTRLGALLVWNTAYVVYHMKRMEEDIEVNHAYIVLGRT